jgi:hypothetical protein
MKRWLFLVLVISLCIVPPVLGVRENFQNFNNGSVSPVSASIIFADATTGNVVLNGGGFINNNPLPFTYAAFDKKSGGLSAIFLLDSSGATISTITSPNTLGRNEIKIIGGIPTLYVNGVVSTTGAAVSVNPSYLEVTLGNPLYYDNVIIGESDHHIVGALPTNWTIQRDLLNPSATGVYAWTGSTWTPTNSYRFYLDADKEFLNPENVVIKYQSGGTVINTTVVTAETNTIQYNVSQFLTTSTALGSTIPDGMYTVSFDTAPAVYDTFWVISSGATVSWGMPVYSQGSTGTVNYAIAGGGYWDQSTYSYSMVTKSIYGTVMNTQTISTQTGTISVPLTTAYTPGVYYAEIVATKISDGTTNVMNIAYTSVTTYIPMSGYVMNEETGAVIPSANMNVSQGLQYQTVTSDANGSWNSNNGWISGSTITINSTASGYKQNIHSFLPLGASTVFLNISMSPTTSTYSGISIGGVVSDSQFGNPIVGATYHVMNVTESTSTTNIAGFARVDGLVNGNLYSVWSSKIGYGNSTVHQIVTVGA